jgi:hypothetical protein
MSDPPDDKGGNEAELVLSVELTVLCGDLESANVARSLNKGLALVSGEEAGVGVDSGLARAVLKGAVFRGIVFRHAFGNTSRNTGGLRGKGEGTGG